MSNEFDLISHVSTVDMSLALDGLLDDQEQRAFDAHLQACPACQGQWRRWQRISLILEAEPFVGPAPGFVLRVDRSIQAERQRRERILGGLVLLGGTLSIWITLLLGLVLSAVLWLLTTPDSQVVLAQLGYFAGQMLALLLGSLAVWRDSLFNLLPAPFWLLLVATTLMIAAAAWLRLVPFGVIRRQAR